MEQQTIVERMRAELASQLEGVNTQVWELAEDAANGYQDDAWIRRSLTHLDAKRSALLHLMAMLDEDSPADPDDPTDPRSPSYIPF